METLASVVFGAVAVWGVFVTLFPAKVTAIWRRGNYGFWSGAWLYATDQRTRIMGLLLTVIGSIAFLSRVFA